MDYKVTGNKIGNSVNVYVNGQFSKKTFSTPEETNDFYKVVLNAHKNPTEEIVQELLERMNDIYHITRHSEFTFENGNIYFKEHPYPVPQLLVDTFVDYIQNGFPIEALENFWKLLITNEDEDVRNDLFDFLATYSFTITDYGYFIAYKAVTHKVLNENDLPTFISNKYLHVKKDWGTSPRKYVIYEDASENYHITKALTYKGWEKKDKVKSLTLHGNLDEMFKNIDDYIDEDSTLFTDKHTKQMDIQLGTPVQELRENCDPNPSKQCSRGLHVGSVKYVESFGNLDDTILAVLVNPAHVVAVPSHDTSKMRVCEYFPYAVLEHTDGNSFETIEEKYFEADYLDYERGEVEKQVAELSKKKDKSDKDKELLKQYKQRLVVLEDSK